MKERKIKVREKIVLLERRKKLYKETETQKKSTIANFRIHLIMPNVVQNIGAISG